MASGTTRSRLTLKTGQLLRNGPLRAVRHTAVPVAFGFRVLNACRPISARPYLADSVHYFQLWAPLRDICSRRSENSPRVLRQVRAFIGWSGRLLCRLLIPATPSRRLATTLPHWQGNRPPRVRRATFLPPTRRIYFRTFRMAIGLQVFRPPRPGTAASYAVRVPRARSLPAASFPRRLATPQLPFS